MTIKWNPISVLTWPNRTDWSYKKKYVSSSVNNRTKFIMFYLETRNFMKWSYNLLISMAFITKNDFT